MSGQRRPPLPLGWSITVLAVGQAIFWLGFGVYHKAMMTNLGIIATLVGGALVGEHLIRRR